MQRDLLSSLHNLLSHICSMVYSKRYILILRSPLVAEKFIVETISLKQYRLKSLLVLVYWSTFKRLFWDMKKEFPSFIHSVMSWTHDADFLLSLPFVNAYFSQSLSSVNWFDFTHELKFIHWPMNKFSIELNRKLVQSSVNEYHQTSMVHLSRDLGFVYLTSKLIT